PAPPAPALAGRDVMLLPAQGGQVAPVPAGLDAELRFWLDQQGPTVRWVFPDRLRSVLASSPALDIDIDALVVSSFQRAEVRRIGDPLFGDLRRLGALVGARYALVPVMAAYVPGEAGEAGRVEIATALIDTIGGNVLWYGVVAGQRGAAGAPEVTASAARAVAEALLR
ncbi:MAG: hypothetical protein ACRELV_01280, partial [Longimicrobiales bacterium]